MGDTSEERRRHDELLLAQCYQSTLYQGGWGVHGTIMDGAVELAKRIKRRVSTEHLEGGL